MTRLDVTGTAFVVAFAMLVALSPASAAGGLDPGTPSPIDPLTATVDSDAVAWETDGVQLNPVPGPYGELTACASESRRNDDGSTDRRFQVIIRDANGDSVETDFDRDWACYFDPEQTSVAFDLEGNAYVGYYGQTQSPRFFGVASFKNTGELRWSRDIAAPYGDIQVVVGGDGLVHAVIRDTAPLCCPDVFRILEPSTGEIVASSESSFIGLTRFNRLAPAVDGSMVGAVHGPVFIDSGARVSRITGAGSYPTGGANGPAQMGLVSNAEDGQGFACAQQAYSVSPSGGVVEWADVEAPYDLCHLWIAEPGPDGGLVAATGDRIAQDGWEWFFARVHADGSMDTATYSARSREPAVYRAVDAAGTMVIGKTFSRSCELADGAIKQCGDIAFVTYDAEGDVSETVFSLGGTQSIGLYSIALIRGQIAFSYDVRDLENNADREYRIDSQPIPGLKLDYRAKRARKVLKAGCSNDRHWIGIAISEPSDCKVVWGAPEDVTPIMFTAGTDDGPLSFSTTGEIACGSDRASSNRFVEYLCWAAVPEVGTANKVTATFTDDKGSTTRSFMIAPKRLDRLPGWHEDDGYWNTSQWLEGGVNACPEVFFIGARGSSQNGGKEGPLNMGDEISAVYGEYARVIDNRWIDGRHAAVAPIGLNYRAVDVDWGFNVPQTYWDSVWGGVEELRRIVGVIEERCGGQSKLVLAGFSQGAHVINLAIEAFIDPDQVAAILFLASPTFHPYLDIDYLGSFERPWDTGSLGALEVPDWADDNTLTSAMCNSGDFVCGGNAEDILNGHADYTSNDLRQLAQFGADATLLRLTKTLPRCGPRDERPTRIGTSEGETITGTVHRDVILGRGGRDRIYGKAGDDVLCGNGAVDRIWGGTGDDYISGGSGHDAILKGGSGNDRLYGNAGFDELTGGVGLDLCKVGTDGGTRTGCEAKKLRIPT